MMRFLHLSVLFVTLFFVSAVKTKPIEAISMEQLQSKTIVPQDNTLIIVNFWATWCKPCIEELPYFEEAGKKYAGSNVKVFLINLDFPSQKEKVNAFIQKKNLQNEVYMLDAGSPNAWIDKIDPSWDGAIPATVMYKGGQKVFFREGDFTRQELDSLIQLKK